MSFDDNLDPPDQYYDSYHWRKQFMPRFTEAYAQKDFKCEDCKSVVSAGNQFFWDNDRKIEAAGKKFSPRVCPGCTIDPPPPQQEYKTKPVSQSPSSDEINALKAKIDALEEVVATMKLERFKELQEIKPIFEATVQSVTRIQSTVDGLLGGFKLLRRESAFNVQDLGTHIIKPLEVK